MNYQLLGTIANKRGEELKNHKKKTPRKEINLIYFPDNNNSKFQKHSWLLHPHPISSTTADVVLGFSYELDLESSENPSE